MPDSLCTCQGWNAGFIQVEGFLVLLQSLLDRAMQQGLVGQLRDILGVARGEGEGSLKQGTSLLQHHQVTARLDGERRKEME